MTKLIARHPVSDFAVWYAGYNKFADFRDENGVKSASVWQSVDDPNDVTVMHEFETAEAAKVFAANPKLREIMQELGVSGPPTIWFVEKAD